MGSWQLSRFEDRVDDHRTATEQAASGHEHAARPLDSMLPVDKSTSGRRVTASGRYAGQLLVPDRELDGKRGFYVLTLLRTDSGKALPVVRGWLPGTADPAKAPAPPAGEVTVTGGAAGVRDARGQRGERAGRAAGRADRGDQLGVAGEPRTGPAVRRVDHPGQGRQRHEGRTRERAGRYGGWTSRRSRTSVTPGSGSSSPVSWCSCGSGCCGGRSSSSGTPRWAWCRRSRTGSRYRAADPRWCAPPGARSGARPPPRGPGRVRRTRGRPRSRS